MTKEPIGVSIWYARSMVMPAPVRDSTYSSMREPSIVATPLGSWPGTTGNALAVLPILCPSGVGWKLDADHTTATAPVDHAGRNSSGAGAWPRQLRGQWLRR